MKALNPSDKIAIVSGSSGEIGKSIVSRLVDLGIKVIGIDIKSPSVEYSSNHNALFYECNLYDYNSVSKILENIDSKYPDIHYLVNCPGILIYKEIMKTSYEDFEETFKSNLFGTFNLTQKIASKMVSNKFGSIVTISSNAGSIPRTNMGAYCASKASLTMLTKCFGLEMARHGIRCNIVSPGSTRTKMQTDMWNSQEDEINTIKGSLGSFKSGIPLDKIAEPKDIADAVEFFISAKSSHITMQEMVVDGGAILGV